jgi:PD-(D/E)XK nuclease superfamily
VTIKQRQHGKGHSYWDGTRRLAGVTTILNGGIPKPALKDWAQRVCADTVVDQWDDLQNLTPTARRKLVYEAPFNTSKEAMARGTDIHKAGEALAHGQEPDVPEYVYGPAQAYADWLRRWRVEPLFVEAIVGNRKYGYAGQLDLIAEIDGRVWLIDIKTGKGVFSEAALQLAAYRYAEVLVIDDQERPMPPVNRVAVAHVLPDTVRVIPVDAGPVAWRNFLYAQQIAQMLEGWKDAPPLGAPIDVPPPPRLEAV